VQIRSEQASPKRRHLSKHGKGAERKTELTLTVEKEKEKQNLLYPKQDG
jgi:hypothetical protein